MLFPKSAHMLTIESKKHTFSTKAHRPCFADKFVAVLKGAFLKA